LAQEDRQGRYQKASTENERIRLAHFAKTSSAAAATC
jgi:hypothetical protein